MGNSIWNAQQVALRMTLKSVRVQAGYTQEQMAKLLEKPQSYISKYENGERRLDFLEVLEICHVIGIEPSTLITSYQALLDDY